MLVIVVVVVVILIFLVTLFIVLSAMIIGSNYEKDIVGSWEKCNRHCNYCKDKEQCMNRPY